MIKKIIEIIKKNKIVIFIVGIIAGFITILLTTVRPRVKEKNAVEDETIREREGTDEILSDIKNNIDGIDRNVNVSKKRVF